MTKIKILVVVLVLAGCSSQSLQPSTRAPAGKQDKSADPSTFEGAIDIQNLDAYKSIYAISDLHGHAGKQQSLLTAAGLIDKKGNWAAGNSLLIITGDSIDKGKNSIDVMDQWIKLMQQAPAQGGRLIHVIGNHELEFFNHHKHVSDDKKAKEFLDDLKQHGIDPKDLFNFSNNSTKAAPYSQFMRQQPIAVRVGKWLFSHTGFYPSVSWENFKSTTDQILQSADYNNNFVSDATNGIVEQYDWWKLSHARSTIEQNLRAAGFSGGVFGHQENAFGCDKDDKTPCFNKGTNAFLIKIDCGIWNGNDGFLIHFIKPAQLGESDPPDIESITFNGKGDPVRVPLRPAQYN